MPRHPFYNTAAWKTLRRLKLDKNPLCELCGTVATDVDHKKSIKSGGNPRDLDNMQSLCHKCHSRKTFYIETLGREMPVKGVNPKTGMPADPKHWWNHGA